MIDTLRRPALAAAAFALALLGVAFAPSAYGDEMVDYLSQMATRRFNRGEFYLAEFTKAKTQNRRLQVTVKLLRPLAAAPGQAKPETHNVTIHNAGGEIPKNKPVIVCARIMNNRAWLSPMNVVQGRNRKQTYFFDRGDPDERYFKITMELLFPQVGQIDLDTFHARLIELTRDDDPKIVDLATHYIGSPLNVYARRDCPEAVVVAFARHLIEIDDAKTRAAMAPFFRHARMPDDGGLVLRLAALEQNEVNQAVIASLHKTLSGTHRLTDVLKQAIDAPASEHQRTTVLQSMLRLGRKAADMWDPLERIVMGHNTDKVTDKHIALAAEILVDIDADRAEATVRKALPAIDSPAVYRFVYARRMYDAVGVLVEKLRSKSTDHEKIVRALLAALTRDTDIGDNTKWIRWWDELKKAGRAEPMVRNRFIPRGEAERRIERLIERLSSDNFLTRRQAQQELHEIGPLANPKLEAALENADFEVAAAAEQLLAENARRLQGVLNQLQGGGGTDNLSERQRRQRLQEMQLKMMLN